MPNFRWLSEFSLVGRSLFGARVMTLDRLRLGRDLQRLGGGLLLVASAGFGALATLAPVLVSLKLVPPADLCRHRNRALRVVDDLPSRSSSVTRRSSPPRLTPTPFHQPN
jgi:hypothetical protein